MRTVRNSSRLLLGAGVSTPPWEQTPQSRPLPPEQAGRQAGTPPRRPIARHAGIPSAMHAGIAHPPRPAARHAGIPPARHAGIPPPCGQIHTCKNITFATSLRTVKRFHSYRNVNHRKYRMYKKNCRSTLYIFFSCNQPCFMITGDTFQIYKNTNLERITIMITCTILFYYLRVKSGHV